MRDRAAASGCISSLLLALGLSGTASVAAGERVIFSDPKSKGQAPAETQSDVKRSFGWENPFGNFKPGGSSLQGVTAPPFAPPNTLAPQRTTPLTPRERDLLQDRRDWILRSPGSGTDTELGVNRAFGVREHSLEGGAGESTAPKGDLLRYYQRLESAESAGLANSSPDSLRNSAAPFSLNPGSGGNYRSPGDWSLQPKVSSLGFTATSSAREDRANPTLGTPGWLEHSFEREGSIGRGIQSTPSASPGSLPGAELTGVARLLGSNPVVSPVSELSITSLDPITAYPDPTREALNPVVSPAQSLNTPLFPADLLAAESRERRATFTTPSAARGPLANPFQAMSGGGKPGDSAVTGKRTLQSIKVQLDLPGRSF